ncbi:unnamed protein product [Closterium sp. NIES-54]
MLAHILNIGARDVPLTSSNSFCFRSDFDIKQLDPKKPLSILCRNFQDIDTYTLGFPRGNGHGQTNIFRAARQCLPGPYTFILKASKAMPKQCTTFGGSAVAHCAPRKSVGVRMPLDPVCHALLELLDDPLLCTSATKSSDERWLLDPSVVGLTYRSEDGSEGVDFIVDGGARMPEPSTVVDMTGDSPVLLRRGQFVIDATSAVQKRVRTHEAVLDKHGDVRRQAGGEDRGGVGEVEGDGGEGDMEGWGGEGEMRVRNFSLMLSTVLASDGHIFLPEERESLGTCVQGWILVLGMGVDGWKAVPETWMGSEGKGFQPDAEHCFGNRWAPLSPRGEGAAGYVRAGMDCGVGMWMAEGGGSGEMRVRNFSLMLSTVLESDRQFFLLEERELLGTWMEGKTFWYVDGSMDGRMEG